MSDDQPSKEQRREAYRHARKASECLDNAAAALGFGDVHELGNAIHHGEFDDTNLTVGVTEITNAYSYLNRGSIYKILPPEDYE